ncbi:MAG: 6-phosphogluconolactonase [Candidatus Krumholzibacteriota bacterium]|nr:6-phosphogluconolactonase [Candidatus Krumholzibacteriota bacterium]
MDRPVNGDVRTRRDPASLGGAAADAFAEEILRDAAERTRIAVALSGGQTPRFFLRLLADRYAHRLPWDRIHLFWSDERYVPADDAESNYAAARVELIDRVPLPAANVHPVPVGKPTAAEAAAAYEKELRRFFSAGADTILPVFDLVLLGIGKDGHTASLFPGGEAVAENVRWAVAASAPAGELPARRITLTLPVINNARRVWFLVAGADKRRALRRALDGDASCPAALVRPRAGARWFVDRAAAGDK